MVVVGGKGTLAGPIVGGVIFGLLPEALRSLQIRPELQWVAYGVMMIVIVSILPNGIVPGAHPRWSDRAARSRQAGARVGRRREANRAMNGHPAAALSVDRLSIRFGGVTAVESMTFEVREGEVLSLIGPNGAGKTSAFNAITGYLPAAAGDIVYRGARLNGFKPSRIAALGVVRTFQKTSVFAGRISARQHSYRPAFAVAAASARHHPRPAFGRARGKAPCWKSARGVAIRRHRIRGRTISLPPSPMASSGCSKSRWPLPPGRRCFSSTSRSPA